MMPKLQADFKRRVSGLLESATGLEDRITFLPWFYYDPLLSVFVEHGSQYDDINSFDYFLCPYGERGPWICPQDPSSSGISLTGWKNSTLLPTT